MVVVVFKDKLGNITGEAVKLVSILMSSANKPHAGSVLRLYVGLKVMFALTVLGTVFYTAVPPACGTIKEALFIQNCCYIQIANYGILA